MARVITFYSYKGGTGRSMALANVAWILASSGMRVLTIDWDLEAPGLHRYFRPFLADKELTGQESEGVIDMLIDFAVRAATPAKGDEAANENWYEDHADFSKWRKRLQWPSGETVRLGPDGHGAIEFVPAGRQTADYAIRVSLFDWHAFYDTMHGGAFLDAAKYRLDKYDYVLIDSRTGVSDTSGICTVHMPDALVIGFTLNYQSIKGAAVVGLSVREQRRDMPIYPVAMRIDPTEATVLNEMKRYAIDALSFLLGPRLNPQQYWYSMEVPYFSRYAYSERLALFEERTSITASALPTMERLTAYITDGAVASAVVFPEGERKSSLLEFDTIAGFGFGSAYNLYDGRDYAALREQLTVRERNEEKVIDELDAEISRYNKVARTNTLRHNYVVAMIWVFATGGPISVLLGYGNIYVIGIFSVGVLGTTVMSLSRKFAARADSFRATAKIMESELRLLFGTCWFISRNQRAVSPAHDANRDRAGIPPGAVVAWLRTRSKNARMHLMKRCTEQVRNP